jgi:hypothetical protein
MFLSRSWMVTALRHFQPPVSTAHNARMEPRFGGCFRRDLLMKRPHNFIDAQNATTLGATMPSRPHTHTNISFSLLLNTTLLWSLEVDRSLSCRASRSGMIVDNLLTIRYLDSLVEHFLRNICEDGDEIVTALFAEELLASKKWLRKNSQKIVNWYFIPGRQETINIIICQYLLKVLYNYYYIFGRL